MEIQRLGQDFSVCRVGGVEEIDFSDPFCFVGKTDEELSLVCGTAHAPVGALARDDGWRALRIVGVLDFSLVGILARLSAILAENGIGIFAVSTYNTDYILTKADQFDRAVQALADAGYSVADEAQGGAGHEG